MRITVTRGASDNRLVILKDGQHHSFELSTMKECQGQPVGKKNKNTGERAPLPMGPSYRPILPVALRQMVVDAWAIEHGFEPLYSQQREAA